MSDGIDLGGDDPATRCYDGERVVERAPLGAAGDRRLLGWGLRAAVYGLASLGGGVALRAMNLGETLSLSADAVGRAGAVD